ncbi:universal stress protein [Naasia sp. SYSU D00948]|uniref:universal stress protein n=1 Tax=Naasia sp. SYSU D00948 TaxID=2817379 RepID=UPI001B30C072|nr:universal stress protein [Naasia sp. SYSU D00948]
MEAVPSPESVSTRRPPPSVITRRVVVALDGGDAGLAALRWALAALDAQRDVLRLLVVETPKVTRARVAAQLQETTAQLPEDVLWWTRSAPDRAHPIGRAMVEHLRPTDLLVLGSDRPDRLDGLVDTSLPFYVAAVTRSPVVIVPREWQESDRVVLLVGENEDSEAPLQLAAREAKRRGGELRVVHAWQVAPGYPSRLAERSAGYEAARGEAHDILASRAARLHELDPGLRISERLVEGPRLAAVRPEVEGAGLAVVGRHGSGVFRDVVLGSLAHDLVGTLPCPLAVVPMVPARDAR